MFIAVIGSSTCDEQTAKLAHEVGRELARRGAVLICGGRGGVMQAACQGAKSEGGATVGILPGTSRQDANPFVDIPVVTGLGDARNAIVVRSADAVIAISGGFGTLSEIGLALKMGRVVVGLGTWELGQGGRPVSALAPAASPVHAVELAIGLAAGREREYCRCRQAAEEGGDG